MKTILLGRKVAALGPCAVIGMAACALVAPLASADYLSGFETVVGSPGGTALTGQDGYYIPAGTTSVDFLVHTYTGNALGLPQNPVGGLQFVAGTGPAGGAYARAQRDVDYSAGRVWTIGYDFAATYTGTGASAQNVGSFSTQLFPGEATYINVLAWVDPATTTNINSCYIAYDAAGVQFPSPYASPGPAWEGLDIDHWYRSWTTFDLDSNQIIEVSIVDLHSGIGATFNPPDWYLEGGAAGGSPIPSGFRFFGGGGVAGNTTAFDNISIVPEPTTLALLALGGLALLRRR